MRIGVAKMSGYSDVLRDEIETFLPETLSLVMDVGCGTGVTSLWLKQVRKNITTIGVEVDPLVAATAAKVLDRVVVTDLDEGLDQLAPYAGQVDLLLLLDVLEHLRDPWTRLREFRTLLSPSGVIIASIPNVRNLKVLLPLLFKGEWQYGAAGILDKTHLHFFTRRSVVALFEGAGFDIQQIGMTGPMRFRSVKSMAGGAVCTANMLLAGALQEFLAHQYLVRAVKSADSASCLPVVL
jgi:2-polyprenyl-3-methyl-5-hydroxy-6-metoxy-1,4-benzoquinol methylase